MKTILILVMISLGTCGYAGRHSEQISDNNNVPTVVLKRFNELYPAATMVEWEPEKKGGYEAEFVLNGREIELLFDSTGNLLKGEEGIEAAELPAVVRENLESRKGMRIARAVQVTEGTSRSYFIVGLTQDDRIKFVFDEKGTVLSETILKRNKKPLVKMALPATGVSAYKKKWELPAILTEISGFSLIDERTAACVQDELGVIYVYDLALSQIRNEIPFAEPGDYEGIAIVNGDAWVLRSDGVLLQVIDFMGAAPKTRTHELKLNGPQNLEGLCFDQKNNRLLLASREFDTSDSTKKGVYAFDLSQKKLLAKPVFSIDLTHAVFNRQQKKGKAPMIPSEIAIHPVSGKYFITDARNFQVLILSSKGEIEKLVQLNRNVFVKTEGIAFTPAGEVLFSNEGKKQSPTLLLLNW